MVETCCRESFAFRLCHRAEATRDRPAHACTMQASGESGDEGSGGGHHGLASDFDFRRRVFYCDGDERGPSCDQDKKCEHYVDPGVVREVGVEVFHEVGVIVGWVRENGRFYGW